MNDDLMEALAATIACNSPSGLQYPWHRKAVQAILSELSAAGLVVVPETPTEKMLRAAGKSPDGVSPRGGVDYLGRMLPKYYQAMIRARPQREGMGK